MDMRRGVLIAVLAATVLGLGGCSNATRTEEVEPPPSTAPATAPAPTPTGDAESDEALLPMPVDDIRTWAETAVPVVEGDGGFGVLSGWLGQHASAHHLTTIQHMEPGVFQGQIACRGDGTITVTVGGIDDGNEPEPVICTNATVAFDVTTESRGMSIDLDLDGDPTVYAVSMLRME